MHYQIIARKYRPRSFANMVGQEVIVTTIKNALTSKRVAQAYLFCGVRGTGKTTLARLFSMALNCEHLAAGVEPCGSCPSCQEIISGNSLNVLEIDGASNRGIDDIRQITETVGYAPSSGKYKIYIIDEVHMLTKEAFNALLKTLEEPPPNVKFFFATTEPHKVPATILSRCQRFELKRIRLDAIISTLGAIAKDLNAQISEEALQLIGERAEGSLRDAESLLDQVLSSHSGAITEAEVTELLGITPRALFSQLDAAVAEGKLSFAFEVAHSLFSSGKDLIHFIEDLLDHYRTVLHAKLKNSASYPMYSEAHCLYLLDFLIQWHQQTARIPFKQVMVEIMLLHIIRSVHRVPVETLVKRLIELEAPPKVEKPKKTLYLDRLEEAKPILEEKPSINQSRVDTLMRFAAVELEGTIK